MSIRLGGISVSVACLAGMIWVAADHVRASDHAPALPDSAVMADVTPIPDPAVTGAPGAAVVAAQAARLQQGQATPSEAVIEASADPTLDTMVELAAVRPEKGSVTNLPVPRYVSLKASEANVRRGPSLSHRIDWVFRHRDMPLRVTAEFGHWRRVEDRDGVGGWLHYSLISGVRTVVFTADKAELHGSPDDASGVLAFAEQGAIARLDQCQTDWCEVTGAGQDGWVRKTEIWGVDARERFE
ncbi:SH3 domain-containing protein [Frigidibacter sp. MR17.24]|uniref:SH3 domain-containing protein n=1 Tax=Frigidibacter sp. MR17.24 TaxID=3127345 RepID=UPI003012CA58